MTNHQLRVAPGNVKWGGGVLDLIAPRLSQLTTCSAPDLEEGPTNFGTYLLGSVFVSRLKSHYQALLGVFIRRIEHAADEYRAGVTSLRQYVDLLPQTNSHTKHYRKALSHFETCVLHAYTAVLLLEAIGRAVGAPPMFETDDGSNYDRLNKHANRIKHFDEDVLKDDGAPYSAFPVSPVWITNNGLECATAALSFVELRDIINCALEDAKALADNIGRKESGS